ncbi:MAG: 50S ribosomal protein L4 [Deltaproteobacteria bacterium]|nr:50S ribosomal protein L4 [Deltaproteobacteria bacterium]
MEVQVIHPQLKDEVFRTKIRPYLLQQEVVMQLSNRRAGSAATKTKGLVRGGGRKPWRQKGTGRARAGSIRSPLWVGGGTIFGPQPRNYSYRLPKSARKEALLSALSLKHQDGKLIVVNNLVLGEAKTKIMRKLLENLEVKSALIIIPASDDFLERAARNLASVKVLRAEGLNVYDLLRYENLVLTQESLEVIEKRLVS